jgi:hypothetical protein
VAPRRRMSRDQEKRYSPWLNAPLTECRPDNPPIDVPEGIIVTRQRQADFVGVPVGGRLLAEGSAGSIKPAGAHRCANSQPTARPWPTTASRARQQHRAGGASRRPPSGDNRPDLRLGPIIHNSSAASLSFKLHRAASRPEPDIPTSFASVGLSSTRAPLTRAPSFLR